MYLAAFAVSSYAQSSYRLGNKPFNPLLGETYECIREDKGWRFVAEQVSSYAQSSYRLGNKPFNPLLGETYECIREDKGWRFVAEQVISVPSLY